MVKNMGKLVGYILEWIGGIELLQSFLGTKFWVVFFSILGLVIGFPATPVQAELDRERLLDIVSGLDVIHDRLKHQTTILFDDESRVSYRQTASYAFTGFRAITQALESSLIGSTTADRAKVEHLLQSLQELDSAVAMYMYTSREVNLDDTDRENLRALFRSMLPELTVSEMGSSEIKLQAPTPKLNGKNLSIEMDLKIQYDTILSQVKELQEHFSSQLE